MRRENESQDERERERERERKRERIVSIETIIPALGRERERRFSNETDRYGCTYTAAFVEFCADLLDLSDHCTKTINNTTIHFQ